MALEIPECFTFCPIGREPVLADCNCLIFVTRSICMKCSSSHKSRANFWCSSFVWEYFHTDWVTLLLTCCYGDTPLMFRRLLNLPKIIIIIIIILRVYGSLWGDSAGRSGRVRERASGQTPTRRRSAALRHQRDQPETGERGTSDCLTF